MALLRWTLMSSALLLVAAGPAAAGWSPLGGPGVPLAELQLDRGRPDVLYVNADSHLWRSNDAGATWRSLQAGLERSVTAFALDPANRGTIWAWTSKDQLWRSRDAGETWSQRPTTPSQYPRVIQLLVDSVDPETLYRFDESRNEDFDFGLQVWVSHDGGASFHAGAFLLNESLLSSPGERTRFFVHPERSELLFFGHQGVLTSRDGGQTWSLRGLFHGEGFYYGRPAPSDPDTLYGLSVSSGCPVRSDDAGAHWLGLACPSLHGYSYGFPDLAVDPRSASHVWLVADVFLHGFHHWLLESNDGGESWSPPRLMPEGAVVSAGGSVVYAGTNAYAHVSDYPERGFSMSRDGGRTWRSLAAGISAGDLSRAFVVQRSPDAGDGWRLIALALGPAFAAKGDPGLFLSKGRREWVKSGRGPFYELAATGGSAAVAVKGGLVVRSQDGGGTWSAVPSAPKKAGILLADAIQPRYLTIQKFMRNDVFGDLVLWTSDDGGATWRQSRNGRAHCAPGGPGGGGFCGFFSAYAVDPFDATHRYAAAFALNGVSHLEFYLSTDGGLSWHPPDPGIPPEAPIAALASDPASPGRLLAGSYDGLLLSEDGGSHWRPWGDLPSSAVVYQLVRDERTATWYAATGAQGIYRSLDGGAHWTLLAGAPDLDAPTIALDPRTPDALIATFKGLGVWQWRP
jgi:photosystem II stability/assembly factor-like uncharacterized protein